MILLTSKKRTENRRKNSPPRVYPSQRISHSKRANAQFTMTTNLPLSYPSSPIYTFNSSSLAVSFFFNLCAFSSLFPLLVLRI